MSKTKIVKEFGEEEQSEIIIPNIKKAFRTWNSLLL